MNERQHSEVSTATDLWTVTGPVLGEPRLGLAQYDLRDHGYVVEEFFLKGVASRYARTVESTAASDTAPFHTRIVVVRPADRDEFNGTVFVEWLNVSGGLDGASDWLMVHRHIMRTRAAWAGVSAQAVGIEGGGLVVRGAGLRAEDPSRYRDLTHPGDAYSFDIFAKAGEALNDGRLLGGTAPNCSIAMGSSQSAMFLVTFINEIDRHRPVYDGFLVHGRGPRGTGLNGEFVPRANADDATRAAWRQQAGEPITDPRVPVITVQSETDVIDLYGVAARCPDGPRTRIWEVAGAAHFDAYGLVASWADDGTLAANDFAALAGPTDAPLGMQAVEPINAGSQQHYVLEAALMHLERWAGGGSPAPSAPFLATTGNGDDLTLAVDERGIARGGLRTPWVDVPIVALSGLGAHGAGFTALFGVTQPLDADTLGALYPGGLDEYRAAFAASLEHALTHGFVLQEDAEEIVAVAKATWLDLAGPVT